MLIDLERDYKKYSTLFAIIVIILLMFLIIPYGLPLDIGFEAFGVQATLDNPTGSEIVTSIIILIVITLWIYMFHKHKEKMKK
jgi:uncharacterized BrkB/YihY/UPF0761 family membrane protein